MNSNYKKSLTLLLGISVLLLGTYFYLFNFSQNNVGDLSREKENVEQLLKERVEEMDRVEKKAARSEYFFKLMRDPATNTIPQNIRNRELEYARTLPSAQQIQSKRKAKNPSFQAAEYVWQSAGPFDLGGRTRALGVDQRNPNIVLAGGVSGGMWKSTNGGESWQLRTPNLANLSVTSLAQDPTNPDTWYYASGEVIGNSASAVGAAYYGNGIYKSTNNGDSWSLIQEANPSVKGFVSVLNTVSRIRVSPTTGTVFIASTGFGIYRSTDGQTFSGPELGIEGEQLFVDLAVASDGTVAATISEADFDDQTSLSPANNHNPGVFISNDDGQSWIEVTPNTYPETYRRSVLTFAPSNPDILYVLTLKGANDETNQGISFHKINLAAGTSEDRSANLPDFRPENEAGYMEMQGGYNMEIAVKPDNENFVIVGGTNLFRSNDGFSSPPMGEYDGNSETQKDQYWIGGYNKNNEMSFALYGVGNHHPDQHMVVFPQPIANPNLMWSAHDGGLSYTTDVTAGSVSWINRDNGYVTSQFFTAAIPQTPGDNRLMGGTQDNGTPFFQLDQSNSQETLDISSGDGGYSYFTENYLYVSSQFGRVIRWDWDNDTDTRTGLDYVAPCEINEDILLFVHPYIIDTNDENIMYYAEDNHIWRNTSLDEIIQKGDPYCASTTDWEELTGINVGTNHVVTTLAVSQTPANILYFAGYSSNQPPVLKRLENSNTATSGATDIPLPSGAGIAGAYVKDIAINPVNANEVIVVMSNYNIIGLYHTLDGGQSWDAIEGNLTGTEQNPGPSLRSAAMIPAEGGTVYLLGTSIGLYSTQVLNGDNTQWGQEAAGVTGNAVTDYVASRTADGDIAAGTHGRGMLYGNFLGSTDVPLITANPSSARAGDEITLSAFNFEFSSEPSENEVFFGDIKANIIAATANQLTVVVPRNVIARDATNNTVTIRASNESDETAVTTFRILSPNNFTVTQNFPNPFSSSTAIPFDLPADSRVTLEIYNITGQRVLRPLWQVEFNAGTYNQPVDFSSLASGVYIYRIVAESQQGNEQTFIESKKMTFIK